MEKIMHRFVIADVFTDRPFSGNQLAVFPDAQGIPERAMQPIAREFNFPETTFVLPAKDKRHACRVRIFTPKAELPFAGHPTVGTAAVLAHLGRARGTIILEEGVGPVPVEVEAREGHFHARFTIDKPVEMPAERPERTAAAAALSLPQSAVLDTWFATGGVRFCFVRLADKAAVDQAQLDRAAWSSEFRQAWSSNLYFFAGDTNLYARMFGPALGIEEDPATGSGAVAIAGVLAARRREAEGTFTWIIEQGVAMGRASRLEATAEKRGGEVVRVKVGGTTLIFAEGTMNVPASY
jgi:trans-2,3-dihydro-3-hydroxyanthranilate isomerase